MKKTFYEKRGRRYYPISEYDADFIDSYRKGAHLIVSVPGVKITKHNIDPNYAAMIAAGLVAEDAIIHALVKAQELRPRTSPITENQQRAWKNLAKELGDDLACLTRPAARDAAEAGVSAMMAEVEKLLTNPAVKKAYDNFILVAKLSKEANNDHS
jgi:hypothetical protein